MVTFRTPEQLRAIGSLKWTGLTSGMGVPTLGAWVAEMDFGTSPQVAATLKQAIDDGLLGYPPSWLEGRVAQALSTFQQRRFGWDIDPDHIRLVSSVLPALQATITHVMRPEAAVVVPTPAYMPFLTIPQSLGHPVVQVPSLHQPGGTWQLDLDGIEDALKAGAGLVVLCNPWNPTGRVLSPEELRAFGQVVSGYDALVFADEIHAPLVLDDPSAFWSYARLDPTFAAHTVTATAASKGWNIAGLPSAQVILPDDALLKRWDRVRRQASSAVTTLGTLGAITAYEGDDAWQSDIRGVIRRNADTVADALAGTGVDFFPPEATYLTWWGFENVSLPEDGAPAAVVRDLAGVAVNTGAELGAGFEQWIRVNLACSPQCMSLICQRITALLDAA